jgi:elongation factor G
MKNYQPADIRSIAFIGHGGCGKTSLGEAILFLTGANTRLGSVDEKTALLDFEEEEQTRGGSMFAAFGTVEWAGKKIHFSDTPGDGNFILEARSALLGADAAISVISAVDGVEVNTERTWRYAKDLNVPIGILINKMDRERADADQVVEDVTEIMGTRAVPLQLPVGKEADFRGIVDLVGNTLLTFATDGSGQVTSGDVPADLADEVEAARETMVESAAEADEELLEKYLEEGELSPEELRMGLVAGIQNGSFVPVFYSAASQNFGVSPLLDALDLFPSPLQSAVRIAIDGGEESEINPDPDGPFASLVCKTFVGGSGKMTVMRVCRGSIDCGSPTFNASQEAKERIGQLNHVVGNKTLPIAHAVLGDIVAVAKMDNTRTLDTLVATKGQPRFKVPVMPQPMIAYVVAPKSKGEEDKVKAGLLKLMEEDPALTTSVHEMTSQIIVSGMGQSHIDTSMQRLSRRFKLDVELSLPPVAYKETIRGSTRVQGRHKKQTGGRGQFGDTWQRISPQPRGEGFTFDNEIKGGVIPSTYIPAVEKGVVEAMQRGPVAGYPVVDVKVVLDDGSFHAVDSSEIAFKMAGSKGFKKGFMECSPTLIEPIVEMEIIVPDDNVGDIMGDVNGRRGRVLSMEPRGRNSVIKAHIPHAEVLEYAKVLQSVTGGKGSYTMTFSHNEEVPTHLQQKVIDASPFKPKDEDD